MQDMVPFHKPGHILWLERI